MVLSLWSCNHCPYDVDLLLCEVPDEETAFAEMRRFLYINGIDSNITFVKKEEAYDDIHGFIPSHKCVKMYAKGLGEDKPENKYRVTGVVFNIYYGSDRPRHERLGLPRDWKLHEEFDQETGETYLFYDAYKGFSGQLITNASGEWYSCAKRYLADLTIRRVCDI